MSLTARAIRSWRLGGFFLLIAAILSLAVSVSAAPWTNRFTYADAAFETVWSSSDSDVTNGTVARSYTWGPRPWFDYKEYYRQSPNALRQVQYFDKARMEINDPARSGRDGVTNGLLTVELVSGRVKMGDGQGPDDNVERDPAAVPVAGDPLSTGNTAAPTYASFRGVATIDNGYRDPDRVGQRIGTTLDRSGNRTNNAELAQDVATEVVAYNTITGHNVPLVFHEFLQNGPVDGLFAFGYPITDPYWIKARVGGVEKDIFVQLYERRVVTYTPSNPTEFKVEMGNVGQHYFQWRYPHLGQPWLAQDGPGLPIAFASRQDTSGQWQVFMMDVNGSNRAQITNATEESVPYSWRRSYAEGAQPRLVVDSKRIGGNRQIFSIALNDPANVRQHTGTEAVAMISFNGAVSPDGTQIAAAIQCCGGSLTSVMLVPFDTKQSYAVPQAPTRSDCRYESPSWLPDGSGLILAGNCGGKFAIYRADVHYTAPPTADEIRAEITNLRPLTSTPDADNYLPRVSPDGSKIVFSSTRTGAGELYMINVDGTAEMRLTSDPKDDGTASWSPDGKEIVFDSNRDGDYEIYKLDLESGFITQLTNNSVDDRWPIWGQ